MAISYYDILGVAEDANEEAIRNGYLKAMRDKHPDLHSGDDVVLTDEFANSMQRATTLPTQS